MLFLGHWAATFREGCRASSMVYAFSLGWRKRLVGSGGSWAKGLPEEEPPGGV